MLTRWHSESPGALVNKKIVEESTVSSKRKKSVTGLRYSRISLCHYLRKFNINTSLEIRYSLSIHKHPRIHQASIQYIHTGTTVIVTNAQKSHTTIPLTWATVLDGSASTWNFSPLRVFTVSLTLMVMRDIFGINTNSQSKAAAVLCQSSSALRRSSISDSFDLKGRTIFLTKNNVSSPWFFRRVDQLPTTQTDANQPSSPRRLYHDIYTTNTAHSQDTHYITPQMPLSSDSSWNVLDFDSWISGSRI